MFDCHISGRESHSTKSGPEHVLSTSQPDVQFGSSSGFWIRFRILVQQAKYENTPYANYM